MMGYIRCWAYDADIHCNICKHKRFGDDAYAKDSEGNEIHPVFSWDELDTEYPVCCGDCFEEIE